MAEISWPQIISTTFGALGGYFSKFYLDRKKEAEERKFEDNRNHYITLILCLKSFIIGNLIILTCLGINIHSYDQMHLTLLLSQQIN
jgi:hypothetical protein